MVAFQILVIWYGISIAICQVAAAPSLCTVTSALKPPLQVSVAAKWPLRSPEEADGVVTGGVTGGGTGAASSSTMVAVPVARVMVAPATLLSTTVKCSFGSLTVSAVIGIEIVLFCSPGAKMTEPLMVVKSAPLVASPATVWKSTVTAAVVGAESVSKKLAALPVPDALSVASLPMLNSMGVR